MSNLTDRQIIAISNCRDDHKKAPQFSADNTHEAVIVISARSSQKGHIGVQYWTPEMIAVGSYTHTDYTVSKFLEKLYK